MLRDDTSKPLYEQIKEYILHNIHTGEFAPHTRIPSERSLAKQFGVSRLTVSKALKELIQAGRLYVQIGKGTYISEEPFDLQLETLKSFTEEVNDRQQIPTSRVLQAELVPADEHVARQLKLPSGIRVVLLRRVRLVNERPIALEKSLIVASICPNILTKHDFSQESLYAVLREQYHVLIAYAEQSFEARAASEKEAHYLEITAGDPVLSINRITYTHDDKAVEYVESVYRGDRYKFRAILRRI
jgi:GntR family transcriptional regulator